MQHEIALPVEITLRLRIAALEKEVADLKSHILMQQRELLLELASRDHAQLTTCLLTPFLEDLPVPLSECTVDFEQSVLRYTLGETKPANANCTNGLTS